MGRNSKLTEAQWEKVGKRLLAGESLSAVAREIGVSKSTLSERFSERNTNVKEAAKQIVSLDVALSKLNVSEQRTAYSLADDLRDISMHLAGAARYSSSTAHRLAGIANGRSILIPDTGALTDEAKQEMLTVAALQKMANDAFEPGVKLLNASKDIVAEQRLRDKESQASAKEFKASNSADAAILYQQLIGGGS